MWYNHRTMDTWDRIQYDEDRALVERFLGAHCIFTHALINGSTTGRDLFRAYAAWEKQQRGISWPMSRATFLARLDERMDRGRRYRNERRGDAYSIILKAPEEVARSRA